MTYKQATDYIDSFLIFGSKLGLERITKLLADLGNPQDKLKFIHIAGTNGKGSTSKYISSILTQAGYKTGLFISPYIIDFRERFQIDGKMISENELCEIVEEIKQVVDTYPKDELPTEFEIVTAIGMMYFYRQECDVVALEVGLGGRFDSTNVIKNPLCSVICSVSIDHTEQLGDTVEKIAFEKAGIIKENCNTVLYPIQESDTFKVIGDVCKQRNSNLTIVNQDEIKVVKSTIDGDLVSYNGQEIKLSIAGAFQPLNFLTAVTAIKKSGLNVSDKDIKIGAQNATFPARLQLISQNPKILLDGAHNPDGIRSLKEHLQKYFDKPVAIIGMMKDKDCDKVLSQIAPLFCEIHTVTVNNPRSLNAEELKEIANKYCNTVTAEKSLESAISNAKDKEKDICICGSFYLCSEALKFF